LSRSLAGEAREAAEMGARLTDRLLTFARRQRLETQSINLNEFVLGLTERRTIGTSIDLSTALAPDLCPTVADPGQVESAVVNLVINARDAMPNGGRLLIETFNATLDADDIADVPGMAAGDYGVLSVADTGHGMAPEVRARAFEPFFTTKPAGKGSGLGLATIYAFARQSGGNVTIYSESSCHGWRSRHGTTFGPCIEQRGPGDTDLDQGVRRSSSETVAQTRLCNGAGPGKPYTASKR
jgi:signal transduction histidine kinase